MNLIWILWLRWNVAMLVCGGRWLWWCLAGILVKEGDKDCAPTRCVHPPANYTNIFCVQLGPVTLCVLPTSGAPGNIAKRKEINQQGIKGGNLMISYYWIVVFIFRKGKSFYAISIESFSNDFYKSNQNELFMGEVCEIWHFMLITASPGPPILPNK